MINRIIALIDTSNYDNNIAEYAIQFAKATEAEVVLCDIVAVEKIQKQTVQATTGMTAVMPIYRNRVDVLVETVTQKLELIKSQYINQWNFIDYQVIKGINYIESLKSLIKQTKANLLLVGRRESPNFLEKWLGNKTTMIADATNIPTLIIPKQTDFTPFQNILHQIELKGRDMTKLKKTVQLAKPFKAQVYATFFDTDEEYILFRKRTSLLNKIARYPNLAFEYFSINNIKNSLNTLAQVWQSQEPKSISNSHQVSMLNLMKSRFFFDFC
ncbi:MAG: universal stress protein [Saprospiraceae bacterium]